MSERRSDNDIHSRKSSLVDYSKVSSRPEGRQTSNTLPAAATASASLTAPAAASPVVSAQMDAVMRLMTGREERTIAEKLADSNRPTWEQYKKDNHDKLNLDTLDQKQMDEYRKQLDEERDRRMAGLPAHELNKKHTKKKKHDKKKRRRTYDSDDSIDESSESVKLESSEDDDKKRRRKHKKHRKHHEKKSRHHRSRCDDEKDNDDDNVESVDRGKRKIKKNDKRSKKVDSNTDSDGEHSRRSNFIAKDECNK